MANWEDSIGKSGDESGDVVSRELQLHAYLEGEQSLKEKTITKSDATRIMRSDRGTEFKDVIAEMKRQGRVVADPPPPTYDDVVKEHWNSGKRVWKQSEIQQLTIEEWNELRQMGELGMNGEAGKEGRIYPDIDGSSLYSYKFMDSENSIPLDSKGVVNKVVEDTKKNRDTWWSQRHAYEAAKKKNDGTLDLLRKNYVPKSEDNRIGNTYINGVLQP